MSDELICGGCEDGSGWVRGDPEMGRFMVPCSVCGPVACVSCLKNDAGLDGLCEKCARPAQMETVCEQGRPILDYPHGVSHLIEVRDGVQVEHVVPHYRADDVLQQAVASAFYERVLPKDAS